MKTVDILFPNKPSETMFVAMLDNETLLDALSFRGSLPSNMSKFSPVGYEIVNDDGIMIVNDAITGNKILECHFKDSG